MEDNRKVILFPKWKKRLEEESLAALKEKQYGEALQKLNKLINYKVVNHEILIGKLICLMELGDYEKAQELCEELIAVKSENYYQYVHIYLTLLFQTSQYELLMEQIEYERKSEPIPDPYIEQFDQLYEMSNKMNAQLKDDKLAKYIKRFFQAVDNGDHGKQWVLMDGIRKLGGKQQHVERFLPLLQQESIHPVVKTTIFQWLQEMDISSAVTVHKLQLDLTIKPTEIAKVDELPVGKETKLFISELEQENPALYLLLEKLLYQYIYVRYPITPASGDVPTIAEALTVIGKERLNLPVKQESDNSKYRYHKQNIELCEALYLSIIEA